MIVLLDYKIIIFNSNGNDFCPLATYLYKYLTLIVLKKTHFKCIYDLQGRRVNAPQKGISIVKHGNKTTSHFSAMQISYKRVKTCYKIKINYRESKSCFYGVLLCKQHPSLTIVPLLHSDSATIRV